ncbi:hypothetical protein DFH08DRAFT_1033960 [Mycena albidolilacea]|uniref:Uncharacterized protein n=1 Tax=Mycena albidolilacea TaxID=1033008 RepID=A0AAD6ZG42_9AGAR|nr:hypothetical protein DFH08DRAFT_1033960 [Mycena albidolilacea]
MDELQRKKHTNSTSTRRNSPPAADARAKTPYDLSTIGQLGTLDDWKEDRKSIFRVLARFSHPSAGRTIRWTLEMQAIAWGCWIPAQMQEAIQDLTYKETGVFKALKALFSRSTYEFDRSEAVSFYLESEWEVKKRAPGAIYPDILSETYNDVALRLGMEPTGADAASFAQSMTNWPLVPDAAWCLAILHTIPGLSIAAIADADHDSLERMPAFTALAPYFDTVFTWDPCAAYKLDRAVFEKPVRYHDALGVRREHSCLVSLLADLDPARELRVPGVWMCYHRNLAENVHIRQGARPVLVKTNLADLAAMFVAAKAPS